MGRAPIWADTTALFRKLGWQLGTSGFAKCTTLLVAGQRANSH
jgi:hypothetical protein